MNPRFFEDLRVNANSFVKRGIARYEKKSGKLAIDEFKEKFVSNALEITIIIIDRIANNEEISIFPFRDLILRGFFELEEELDSTLLSELYSEITEEIVIYIEEQPNYDPELVRSFKKYLELISQNINSYTFYSGSTIINILQNQPEYQYSEIISSFSPIEVSEGKIYTLFPKERYWENFSKISEKQSYIPLTYARNNSSVTYEDLLVYNNELYKVKPDTTLSSREVFFESDWIRYSPKRFDVNKTFKSVYASSIRSIIGKISEEGFEINNIISDSSVSEYNNLDLRSIESDLVHSFGGEGRQISDSINQLNMLVNSFGGYEGSLIGGFEYIAEFSKYLFSGAFGRYLISDIDSLDGNNIFGQFNLIFNSKTSQNRIPGLKFLDGFAKLKSFVHNQALSFEPQNPRNVRYNPIYERFFSGIVDFYEGLESKTTYSESPKSDLLLYSIELLYKKCNIIGDLVQGVLSTMDQRGFLPGYEGLGSIKLQFLALQNVFPPSGSLLRVSQEKIEPGLTGLVRYLRDNYLNFSKTLINPTFPGRSMEFLLPWIDRVVNKLEEVIYLIEEVGIGTSAFIPNLSFKTFLYEKENLVEVLRSFGFRDSEINQLLEVESFEQLLKNFAPLSDSSDLKSFFKAYELTQLIYEIGGDEAINTYLSFLYSNNSLDSLLNILDISLKKKSTLTYVNLQKYPKLIGLLIGLTYAIDPQQLIKFERILGENNLSLLESISFLLQSGEDTIIKSQDDIRLLKPMLDQIVSGVYPDAFASPSLNYFQANSLVPVGLRSWTKLIGDNLGKVTSVELIHDLYDRSVGLTPKELISILNNPDSPNVFNVLVDGFEGGELTKFLKYVNLTGLGFKLGFYRNSYQTSNFEIEEDRKSLFLVNVLSETKSLIKGLSAFKTVLDASFDYNFKYQESLVGNLTPFIRAQNKKFEVIPTLIEQGLVGSSLDELNEIAGDFEIAESPGIGNSRLPNRIPVQNSLTSEQANILLDTQQELIQLSSINQQNFSLISKFIKISQNNILANRVNIVNESTEKIEVKSRLKTFTPATKYEINITPGGQTESGQTQESSFEYLIPILYTSAENAPMIKSSGLGSNYISNQDPVDSQLVESFDPIKSCERFGGSNCAELYENNPERCVNSINKSILAEGYTSIPGVLPSSVVIDRPLGTFASYRPQETLLPLSSASSPPSYIGLLPHNTMIGAKGEPILKNAFSNPIIFEVGDGRVSEYNNTEFGGVEFIKAQLERNSEFNCATFESPFQYQLCMNIMKCKRFDPENQNYKYLDFCPKSLSGGRLK